MNIQSLVAALVLVAGVAACSNETAPPTPVASGPISMPGERAASPALATPPDEWVGPARQTAQAN